MGWKEFAMNEYKKDDMIDGLETPSSEQSGPLAYQKPILISYGDVRDITLGSSFGEGDQVQALDISALPSRRGDSKTTPLQGLVKTVSGVCNQALQRRIHRAASPT